MRLITRGAGAAGAWAWSIFDSERIWEKMFALTVPNRDRKTLLEAIACIDCAVWDVIGKATGRSVRELLGGYRDAVPIISIGGYYMEGKTLADIGREMELYRRAGMAGCKFKVGGLSPEEDAKRVRPLPARRRATTSCSPSMPTAAGRRDEAIGFARLVEPLDIALVRRALPLVRRRCHDGARAGATRIPINAGQSEITSHGVRRLLDAGAVDYRQLRCVRVRRRNRLAARGGNVLVGRRQDGAPRGMRRSRCT